MTVLRYQRHLRLDWERLSGALDAPDPRYLVVLGSTVTVLSSTELAARLAAGRSETVIIWRAPALEQVRRDAQLHGIDLP